MATRAQQLKVGVFLSVSAVLIVSGILIMQGVNRDPKATYNVRFDESVLGLGVGGLVEYVGVPVGTVTDIRVANDNSAQVVIEISTDKVTLYNGVRAQLVMVSFATGQMAISLKGGNKNAGKLEPGSTIPTTYSTIQTFSANAETMLSDLSAVVARLNAASEGIEPGQLGRMMEQVEFMLADARDFMASARNVMNAVEENADTAITEYAELATDLRNLSAKLSNVADSSDEFLRVAREKIEPVDLAASQENLNTALENFAEMSAELKRAVASLDDVSNAVLHETDNIEHTLREGVNSMTDAFEAMEELANTLNEDPSALLRGRSQPRD